MLAKKYYETDLVTTDDIFNVISVADYLIMQPLYKIEFYRDTLKVNDLVNDKPTTLSINEEVERIINIIVDSKVFNPVFTNVFDFVRQEYDDNYQQFLSELLMGRYEELEMNKIIATTTNYQQDIEGKLVKCFVGEPEGRRYFHMIHSHIKFMEIKEQTTKEKDHAMQGMFDGLKNLTPPPPPNFTVGPFSNMPPPSPDEQKFIAEMFKKMLEDSMKHRNTTVKKQLEYEQLKKENLHDVDDDDDEFEVFDMDDDGNNNDSKSIS